MRMKLSTRVSFCIIGLLLIAVLGVWQLYTGDTFVRQKRRMEIAKVHVPAVRQKLDTIPEFRHLSVSEYTAAGGSLLVGGFVPSEVDVKRIIQMVRETSPPVEVVYHVFATNEFR